MNRRGFLQGILAAGVAPAFIGSSILMPVRKIITQSQSQSQSQSLSISPEWFGFFGAIAAGEAFPPMPRTQVFIGLQ